MKPVQILLGGAGLSVLGTFLPWASVSIPMLGISQTVSGIGTGGGKIVFVLAAAAGALPFIKQPGKEKLMALISMICAGLAALVAVLNLIDVAGSSPEMSHPMMKDGGFNFSIGIGLYLCVIGTAAGAWAAFNIWKATPAPQNPGPPALPPQG